MQRFSEWKLLSNCLIEAIKAKIRNWRGVKIGLYYANWWKCKVHFYWIENGLYHDFTHAAEPFDPMSTLLFSGRIRTVDEQRWNEMKKRNEPLNK